jgi:5-hydroxyisourate hydrolase
MIMAGRLSTHVLDTINGCPAVGMRIELWSLAGEGRTLLKSVVTGADGRTGEPLLCADEVRSGTFELLFFVGDYFDAKATPMPNPRFLDVVPVRFGIADANANYHIPLLCTPWAYSTYRGS